MLSSKLTRAVLVTDSDAAEDYAKNESRPTRCPLQILRSNREAIVGGFVGISSADDKARAFNDLCRM